MLKTLNSPPKFLIYAVIKAIRHPRTPISYYVCGCGCRFPNSAKECPKCGNKIEHSPEHREQSPIPWWGSVAIMGIGVGVCVSGACFNLPVLDRVGDALVFIPLGNLYGMSIKRA